MITTKAALAILAVSCAAAAADKSETVIPAGTLIAVGTIDPISGKEVAPGKRYRAYVADPVTVGNQVVIPKNSAATIEVVEGVAGQGMTVRLRDITADGRTYSTSTEFNTIEATGTSKKKSAVKRGVGLGAIGAGIGAIAGGGAGAGIGAAIGGGAGAASAVAAKGKQINVPPETRLVFTLTAPVPVK
jgi:hypothetical protein